MNKGEGWKLRGQSIDVRLMARVDKTSSCWIWTGDKWPKGYGRIRKSKSKQFVATHRLSYEIHKGPIPDGLQVLHRCDNPSCVNPDHLFVGTNDDNVADKVSKGRQSQGEKQPMAKLTTSQVEEIKRLYTGYWGQQTNMAIEYGVSSQHIRNIVLGKKRKNG